MKPPMMTAEEISQEIFGGKIAARVISETYSFVKGYPKCHQAVPRAKKFWVRSDIYKHYGIETKAAA
jgi:hypothetical protein